LPGWRTAANLRWRGGKNAEIRSTSACSSHSRWEVLKDIAAGPPVEMLDSDSIFRLAQRIVQQAATAGNCVILGRGSQHFLQDRKDTLRFFLYAPTADKVSRLVSEGNTQAHAEALVDTVDRERAAFIKNYFHAEWPNRGIYHAMINTALGEDAVVDTILGFLKQDKSQKSTVEQPIAINQ
jgi:hypothetical protein